MSVHSDPPYFKLYYDESRTENLNIILSKGKRNIINLFNVITSQRYNELETSTSSVAMNVCAKGKYGGSWWGPRVYNAVCIRHGMRYKMWSQIKPPVAQKTFSLRCEEPLGDRPSTIADHVVSSPIYLSPWITYNNFPPLPSKLIFMALYTLSPVCCFA